VPRITDFGLAKFLAAEDAHPTRTGAILGTPAYMAPEQAGGKTADVGPAADVYALGAILYELLTGRPPFGGEDALEILLQVRDQEPIPPGRLRPKLPRDLGTICVKCLEKDPRSRYASAKELADDLSRFRRGEPVAARPAGPWERALKWARRRPALAGLIAVAVTAAGALAALGALYHFDLKASYAEVVAEKARAVRARATAEEQKGKAEKNLRTAEAQRRRADSNLAEAIRAVNAFHIRLSEVHLLNQPGQKDIRREVLREAAQAYRQLIKEQNDNPAVRTELGIAYMRLALVTGELETPARGVPVARKGVAMLEGLVRERPTEAHTQTWISALVILGRLHLNAKQLADAERVTRQASAAAEKLERQAPRDPASVRLLASVRTQQADFYVLKGRLNEAEDALQKALKGVRRTTPLLPDKGLALVDEAETVGRLAAFYREVGQFQRAEVLIHEALALYDKAVRASPSDLRFQRAKAICQGLLGDLYKTTGQVVSARDLYKRAVSDWVVRAEENPSVPEYAYFVARGLLSLGETFAFAGDGGSAAQRYRMGLSLIEKLLRRHPLVPEYREVHAGLHAALASVQLNDLRLTEALKGMGRAVEIQSLLVADCPDVPRYRRKLAGLIGNRGLVQHNRGQFGLAEADYEEALKISRREAAGQPLLTEAAVHLGGVLCNLGNLRCDQKRPKEALNYYAEAVAALRPAWERGRKHSQARLFLRNAYVGRAAALAQLGRHKEALAEWDQVLDLDTTRTRPHFLAARALALAHLGEHARALADVETGTAQKGVGPQVCYELAAACAVAVSAADRDNSLAEAERQAAAGRYAGRAVQLLVRAEAAGYFKTAGNVQRLLRDARFDAVRAHADYRAFAAALSERGGAAP
jgi:serine/threonine-protein kinase